MDTPDKIQFHPGFYGAAELEFRLETAEIEFNIEYNLSKEPLRVDLLVVGKQNDIQLENEAGRIFRRYNIIEYKSPDDRKNRLQYHCSEIHIRRNFSGP